MIVSFFARGSGGGSGPVDYLLGKDRKRENAEVLSGDADLTVALIDSSNYEKKYTSGVLSFEEENITDEQKRQIMASFEDCLFPGMDKNQFNTLWVEHTDKGRLELNFVIPNIELTTGKRLQPYYHAADLKRVDAWRTIQNIEHGLTEPNDPAKRQTLTPAKDLPRSSLEAVGAINEGIAALVKAGKVKDRQGVVQALEGVGFEVARQTKTSISIKNPDGGRNIRLKGAFYEQDFRLSQDLQRSIEQGSREFQQNTTARLEAARERYQYGVERKQESLARRYPSEQRPIADRNLRESKTYEYESFQDLDNRDIWRGGSIDSASRLEHMARHFNQEKVARDKPIGAEHSDLRGTERKPTIQSLRGRGEVMRDDRRGSPDLSGRLQNTERILEDDGSREIIARHIAKLEQDEKDRAREFSETLTGLGGQATTDNEAITTLARETREDRTPTRADQFIDRAKQAISRAFRAAEQFYQEIVKLRDAQKQERSESKGMSR